MRINWIRIFLSSMKSRLSELFPCRKKEVRFYGILIFSALDIIDLFSRFWLRLWFASNIFCDLIKTKFHQTIIYFLPEIPVFNLTTVSRYLIQKLCNNKTCLMVVRYYKQNGSLKPDLTWLITGIGSQNNCSPTGSGSAPPL